MQQGGADEVKEIGVDVVTGDVTGKEGDGSLEMSSAITRN
jgi:hypothetical protein